jgi:hypothetical protein
MSRWDLHILRAAAIAVILLTSVLFGAPQAAAQSRSQPGDQITPVVPMVPNHVWVGENVTLQITFRNPSIQDQQLSGPFSAFRVFDVGCGTNQVWQRPGTVASTPPGLTVAMVAGDQCGITYALAGTVPARSQRSVTFSALTLNPGVIPVLIGGQTYEVRVITPPSDSHSGLRPFGPTGAALDPSDHLLR